MNRAEYQESSTLTVRRFSSDEWRSYRELRLRALRDSPDAFGSTLARETAFSDDEWSNRLAAGVVSPRDFPILAKKARKPVGLAWVRIEENHPESATLYQVWVDPSNRRQGVGRMLLDAALAWARAAGASEMMLNVASGAPPAMQLYSQAGFISTGEPTPLRPGSDLMQQRMRRPL